MKKLKKQIVLFAVAVFVIFMAPQRMMTVSAADGDIAGGTSNNITWVIDANGKLTVSGSGDFLPDRVEYEDVPPWYPYRTAVKSAVVNVTGMTDAENLFHDCTNMVNVDLSRFDTSKIRNMGSMFKGCSSLQSLNLNNFNTANVEYMGGMFSGCSSLQNVNLSSFNTANVEGMSFMFMDCSSLSSLDLSNFNTGNVINMCAMFSGCSNLKNLNIKNFDTANVTDMGVMFHECSSLTSLDLSRFDTAKVESMNTMFSDCRNLTNLDIRNFCTANVTDMGMMFESCQNLTSLDLSHFDTTKVENMNAMFCGCSNLTNLDIKNFRTANVTDMSLMFTYCQNLTSLDLSGFDTEQVTNMSDMFNNCQNLTRLDLSNFNATNVVDMTYMFHVCNNLTVIHIPYNIKVSANLQKKSNIHWFLADGTEITELPQNLDHSVTITRKSTGTVEDNKGDNNNEKPDTTDKDNNNQHWNNGASSDQTGATSGVLEGTGNSTDSAVYGKKLLTAKATDFKTILLSWDAAPNAKSYEIFYSTSPNGGFKRLANVKKTSYKFSKAKCGVTYYFQMRVCEKKLKSEFGPVSYAKTALTGSITLQVKRSTYNSVQLKWNKVPGAKKYEIFYADSMGGSWQSLGIKGGTSFTHKKLVTGATYYYQVRPVRDTSRGSWSNGVSATTALGDVVGLKAKAAGSDRMKLSWKKVRGATRYVILRSDSIDGTYETIGHSGKASYMDTGLSGRTTYFYKVYAVSGPYRTKETAPVGQTTKIPKK